MANSLYDKGRQGFLDGSIDWDDHTIKCLFLKSSHAPNLAVHDNLDDIAAGDRLSSASAAFGSKTVTDGVADAADITIAAVPAGTAGYILIYKDTGNEATSRLIALIDTGTGLPLATNGSDVTIYWDNGANRIFKL